MLSPQRLFIFESLTQSILGFFLLISILAICPNDIFIQYCFLQSLVIFFHGLSLAALIEPRLSKRFNSIELNRLEGIKTQLLVVALSTIAALLLSLLFPSTIWRIESATLFPLWLFFMNSNVAQRKKMYIRNDARLCQRRIATNIVITILCAIPTLWFNRGNLACVIAMSIIPLILQKNLYIPNTDANTTPSEPQRPLPSLFPFFAAAICAHTVFSIPVLIAGVLVTPHDYGQLRALLVMSQPAHMMVSAHAQGKQMEFYRVFCNRYNALLTRFFWRSFTIALLYNLGLCVGIFYFSSYTHAVTIKGMHTAIEVGKSQLPFVLILTTIPFLLIPASIALRIDKDELMLTKCYAAAGAIFIILLLLCVNFTTIIPAYSAAATFSYLAFFIFFIRFHKPLIHQTAVPTASNRDA